MAEQYFVTGFPGFIAKRLMAALAEKLPAAQFVLLVEPRFESRARLEIDNINSRLPGFKDRAATVAGDITRQHLNIPDARYQELCEKTTQVWHLAAIYDLAIDFAFAHRVNVEGTANLIAFCREMKNLRRFNYVSTCFVAGDRSGTVMEDELNMGQAFKNHYESTKFAAELQVREAMKDIPTSIYRPSIVVGDTKTGETDKYDGPYFPMLLLLRLPTWIPPIYLGEGRVLVNVLPIDFLIAALTAISLKADTAGKTFHLADPNPVLVREFWAMLMEMIGFGTPKLTIPMPVVRALFKPKIIRQLARIPYETLDYFEHAVSFDTTNLSKALEGTGITCPRVPDYVRTLLDYAKTHPKLDQLRKQIY